MKKDLVKAKNGEKINFYDIDEIKNLLEHNTKDYLLEFGAQDVMN